MAVFFFTFVHSQPNHHMLGLRPNKTLYAYKNPLLPLLEEHFSPNGEVKMVHPKTGDVVLTLPQHTKLENKSKDGKKSPYLVMLNHKGEPYQGTKGEKPFYGPNNSLYLGVAVQALPTQLQGKIPPDTKYLAVWARGLSNSNRKGKSEWPTPDWTTEKQKIEASTCPDDCNTPQPIQAISQKLQPYLQDEPIQLSKNTEKALNMINKFHNQFCEKSPLRKIKSNKEEFTRSQVAKEALFKEWEDFINQQDDKATAEKARALDLSARTILFEAHPLGGLEKEEKDKNIQHLNISQCERKAISYTIINRAADPNCTFVSCEKKENLANRISKATTSEEYNIWMSYKTHPMISSCFLKDGVQNLPELKKGESKMVRGFKYTRKRLKAYQNRVKGFQSALASAAVVLDAKEGNRINKLFSFQSHSSSGQKNHKKMPSLQYYMHPRGMSKCEQATEVDHTFDVYGYAYNTKTKTYKMLRDVRVSPTKQNDRGFSFIYRKWARGKFEMKTVPDDESKENSSSHWTLSNSYDKKKYKGVYCVPYGLREMKNKTLTDICSKPPKPPVCSRARDKFKQTRIPEWALEKNSSLIEISCKRKKGQDIKYSGPYDNRAQFFAFVHEKRETR